MGTPLSLFGRTTKTLEFLATDPVRDARTGTTPHDVVFRQGKVALRHFPAAPGVPRRRAVLVSMPLINTWSVWTCSPGAPCSRSWPRPASRPTSSTGAGPADQDELRPLSWYVDDVLTRLFDRARRHDVATGGTGQLEALGYCVGGKLLLLATCRCTPSTPSAPRSSRRRLTSTRRAAWRAGPFG